MVALIIGGSGSGKSSYAEDYTMKLSEGNKKFYLATMQVYDEEGRAKVERHRRLREGKGFATVERPVDIEKAMELGTAERVSHPLDKENSTVLLECMSNLVANEMFSVQGMKSCEEVVSKITEGVLQLSKEIKNLVIVSNNVFEDGIVYDGTTQEYIRAMGLINTKLAELADVIVEVVVGIPVTIKADRCRE